MKQYAGQASHCQKLKRTMKKHKNTAARKATEHNPDQEGHRVAQHALQNTALEPFYFIRIENPATDNIDTLKKQICCWQQWQYVAYPDTFIVFQCTHSFTEDTVKNDPQTSIACANSQLAACCTALASSAQQTIAISPTPACIAAACN